MDFVSIIQENQIALVAICLTVAVVSWFSVGSSVLLTRITTVILTVVLVFISATVGLGLFDA